MAAENFIGAMIRFAARGCKARDENAVEFPVRNFNISEQTQIYEKLFPQILLVAGLFQRIRERSHQCG
jgi:hypothetical protein